jgi:hypothetical protein
MEEGPFSLQSVVAVPSRSSDDRLSSKKPRSDRSGGAASHVLLFLATVVIPIAIVTEMEPEPAAVVVPITVFDAVITVSIAFLRLCRTLEPGESQQAETGRAREREKFRTHWELLLMGRGGMSGPVS